MPCTTLVLALALSVTQLTSEVPLEFASEDDEVVAATFDSTGAFALISHLQTNSLTRYNVATGLIDSRLETGGFGPLVALPGSSDVLLLNRVSRALDIIDTGSMMVTASIPVGLQAPSELIVDSTGTRAVVRSEMAGEPVAVVDIASRTIERTIDFAAGVDTLSSAPRWR